MLRLNVEDVGLWLYIYVLELIVGKCVEFVDDMLFVVVNVIIDDLDVLVLFDVELYLFFYLLFSVGVEIICNFIVGGLLVLVENFD